MIVQAIGRRKVNTARRVDLCRNFAFGLCPRSNRKNPVIGQRSNSKNARCQWALKVAPYSFLSARALISKISRWRKLSNSTPKSRGGSHSKMPTNMASKLLQFVYRKCCVDRLLFQNICRLNRRPQLSLLDVKEKYTRQAGVSTNEAEISCDLFDRHDHRAGQSKMVYYHTSLALFVEQTQKLRYK